MYSKIFNQKFFIINKGGGMFQKSTMFLKNSTIWGVLITGLLLSACTKEVPYKYLAKEEVFDKPDTDAEYLYSSSMQNASMSSSDALPFSSGDNKRVRLKLTKESLQVLESERDARFKDNSTNDKLVLEVPIEHLDFQCAKDKYGECTNTEEENKDLDWNKKSKIKIKLGDTKIGEIDMLPIMISQTMGQNCYQPVSSRLVRYEFTKEAINFQIERVFKTDFECLNSISKLSDATISAVFHYSLVKTDKVLSSDFKPVEYPKADSNTFGFFETEKSFLGADNNKYQSQKVTLMNHWNPNREVIDYYLSDEFKKPEYEDIKKMTYKTVENINDGLAKADVKFRIKLHEPDGKIPGDIRNSMIVLVEDPVASSVIGYGPQTEDPVTGEIVSARTIMFLGTIKKYIQYTYDDIIRAKKRIAAEEAQKAADEAKKAAAEAKKAADKADKEKSPVVEAPKSEEGPVGEPPTEVKAKIYSDIKFVTDLISKSIPAAVKNSVESAVINGNNGPSSGLLSTDKLEKIQKAVQAVKSYKNYRNDDYDLSDVKSRLKYMMEVKNCAYTPEMNVSADGGISGELLNQFSVTDKYWKDLSEGERQAVISKILPVIWIPTLIHEMGHNLGLRHNFEGSEDKANFYSAEERKQLNIDHEIPFSTVMEYGDDLKTLSVLGKYDIAALKFGYNRKIEMRVFDEEKNKNGDCFFVLKPAVSKLLQVKDSCFVSREVEIKDNIENLKNQLQNDYNEKYKNLDVKKSNAEVEKESAVLASLYMKPFVEYKYCTDEHTGVSAGCRRFDIGTTYVEIVKNEIQNYYEGYQKRNFRNDREHFSIVDDLQYASGVRQRFMGMRIMLEILERIQGIKKINFSDPDNMLDPEFADIINATNLAGNFFLDVINTPDAFCVINNKKTGRLAAIKRLGDLGSCEDMNLLDKYKVTASFGKAFNNKKLRTNPSSYIDQIYVRGYAYDKMMAVDMLLNRKIGNASLDSGDMNFLDFDPLKLKIINNFIALTTAGALPVKTMITNLEDGHQYMDQIYVGDLYESNTISKPAIPIFGKILGLPNRESYLQERILSKLTNEAMTGIFDKDNSYLPVSKMFSVTRKNELSGPVLDSQKYITVSINNDRFFIDPKQNILAYTAIKYLNAIPLIDKIKDDQFYKLYELKVKYNAAAEKKEVMALPEMTEDEKAVFALDENIMAAKVYGIMGKKEMYLRLLYLLPNMASQ